jgi:hypothetical protein
MINQDPNQNKKFLVIRFAPGSGGKFLSILFQCSDSVHAWDDELVAAKQQKDYDKIFNYIISKFTTNFNDWLKIEPEVPYQTDFVSNRFSRGDDITFDQAQQLLANDSKYQHDFQNRGQIALILNKPQVPAWIWDMSNVVNILIDTKESKKWFYQARYKKQFVKNNNSYIIKQEHKDFCSPKRAVLASKFNNETVFHGSWHGFAKKYLVGDPIGKIFTNKTAITSHPSNVRVENLFFNLSSYLNKNRFVEDFHRLCTQLDIIPLPSSLLLKIIHHYQSLHEPSLNNTIRAGLSYNYSRTMQKTKAYIAGKIKHPNYIGAVGDQVCSWQLDEFFESTNQMVLVTDNKITVPAKSNQTVLSIAPEYYGIHYMPFDLPTLPPPERAYNCFINRICPNRQSWFYKLYDIGLDKGFVSFNIDYQNSPSQTYKDKLDLFDQLHFNYNTIFQRQYEGTRSIVPFCNFEQTSDIENIVSKSVISLVIETYFDDNRAIALSEKTFRALQLPRPFLLYGPKGIIHYLKSIGFKIIDDIVDHSYDSEENWAVRQTLIVDQLKNFANNTVYDVPQSWIDIAYYNQQIMRNWSLTWDLKIESSLNNAEYVLNQKQ